MSTKLSSLSPRDYSNLRYALSLSKVQFSVFYEDLDEHDQIYLSALLETHRLDILDHAFNKDSIPKPDISDLLNKLTSK